jgi:hypothetical protein
MDIHLVYSVSGEVIDNFSKALEESEPIKAYSIGDIIRNEFKDGEIQTSTNEAIIKRLNSLNHSIHLNNWQPFPADLDNLINKLKGTLFSIKTIWFLYPANNELYVKNRMSNSLLLNKLGENGENLFKWILNAESKFKKVEELISSNTSINISKVKFDHNSNIAYFKKCITPK